MTDTKDNHPAFDAGLDLEAAARTERAYLAAALEDPARVIPEAVRRGMTGEDFTGEARGVAFNAILSAFRDGGAVDAVIVDQPVALDQIKKNANLKILDGDLGSEQYGIAFRSGDAELCAKIEEAVAELVKDGTYAKIASKDAYKDITNNLIFLNDAK